MAGGNQLVPRVRILVILDGTENVISRINPRLPKTIMSCTTRAEVGIGESEVDIGEPILNRRASTESYDYQAVGMVNGNVTGHVGTCDATQK
jgi:hypothetical protein